MPIYAYRCADCNHDFELLVRSSTVPACPACGSLKLDKQVAAIAPHSKSAAIIASGRRAAAKEGHFSNYSKSDQSKTR